MSTSINMISTVDSDKSVFITHEAGWKNVRIYMRGKLLATVENPSELKSGIHLTVEGLGTIYLKANPATLTPKLSINGESYKVEKRKRDVVQSINGVYAIFITLAFFNLLLLVLSIPRLNDPITPVFSFFVLIISSFYSVAYVTSVILLARGVYIFYFIGTGLFTISTLYFCYMSFRSFELISLLFLAPRIILLIVLGLYFRRILGYMKEPKDEDMAGADILDDSF